jgi:5-methylcytosine-specific restriction endonuclease McrA
MNPGEPLKRSVPLRQVSARRAVENRQRRAMAKRLWPDGQPPCSRPGCSRLADDLHEPLARARGGSIVDEQNARPLCRPCHNEVTFSPESELGWAYQDGLLVHSWNAPKTGGAA